MRAAIVMCALALAVGLGVAGCGNSSNNTTDLSMAVPDMSVNADLTVVGTHTCFEVISCAQNCTTDIMSCVQGCAATGTAQAQAKYQALAACAIGACSAGGAAVADGGTPPCASAGDTSQGCLDCVGNQATKPVCSTQFNACLSDS